MGHCRHVLARFLLVLTLFVCLLNLVIASDAHAAPLNLPQSRIDLTSELEHFADQSGALSATEVVDLQRAGAFVPFDSSVFRQFWSDGVHWFHVELSSQASTPGTWVLDTSLRTALEAEIFVLRDGRIERVFYLPNGPAQDIRDDSLQGIAAAIEIGPSETVSVLIKLHPSTDYFMKPRVSDQNAYQQARIRLTQWQFTFYGALLTMAVVGLLASLSMQLLAPLHYSAMLLVIIVWFMHLDGLANTLIWSGHNGLSNVAVRPIFCLMVLLGGQFLNNLFDLQRNLPVFRKLVQAAMVAALFVGASSFVSDHRLVFVGYIAVGFFAGLVYFALSVVAVSRRWSGSLPILLGSSAIAVAVLVLFGKLYSPTLSNAVADIEIVRIATLIEAASFLLAIWYKVTQIRLSEAEASAQAIELLEAKVALTAELRRTDEDYSRAALLAERRRRTLAFATHDLHQPLAAIRTMLHRASSLPSNDRETLERHCTYLQNIVETYLDGAEPKAAIATPEGRADLFPASLIVDGIQSIHADEAKRQGITLKCMPSSLQVSGDPLVIMRIVSNLVSNALQHSKSDVVLFGCRPMGDHVAFVIADRGCGMSDRTLDALFAAGQKGEASEGRGLGLAIARDLAAQLGLSLTARSQMGKGTSFCLSVKRENP